MLLDLNASETFIFLVCPRRFLEVSTKSELLLIKYVLWWQEVGNVDVIKRYIWELTTPNFLN